MIVNETTNFIKTLLKNVFIKLYLKKIVFQKDSFVFYHRFHNETIVFKFIKTIHPDMEGHFKLHFITSNYTLSLQITLYYFKLHFISSNYTLSLQITLYHFKLHFITSNYTLSLEITLTHLKLHLLT